MEGMKSIRQLYLELARGLVDARRYAEALDLMQKALAEPDGDDQAGRVEVLVLAGRANAALSRPNEAIKCFIEAIDLNPGVFSDLSADLDPLAKALSETQNGAFNQFLDSLKSAADKASQASKPAQAEAILKWISSWRPEDSVLNLNLSDALRQQGKLDESLTLLIKAASTSPALQTSADLGLAYLQSGNFTAALQTFNELLASDPDNLPALKGRGAALRQLGNLEASLADLQRALDLDPADGQVYSELAATQLSMTQPLAAAESYFQATLRFLDAENAAEALRCAELSAQLDPSNWQYLYAAASLLNNQGQFKEALVKLQAITPLNRNADVLVETSRAHYMLEQYPEALQFANEALALDGQMHAALMYKGSSLRFMDQPEEALVVLEKVIALQPEDLSWCYAEKGAALEALDRDQEALQAFQQAVELDPTNEWAQGSYGRQLRWNDRQEEALVHLDEAMRLYGDEPQPWLLIQKGHTLYDMGDYTNAIPVYDQLLAFDPSQAGAARYKGISLSQVGKYNEAVAALQVAIDLDAAQGKVEALPYAELGDALRMLERYREAETALRKAIELQSDYQWAKARLGEVLRNLKQYDQAVVELKDAVRLKEDDYWAWATLGAAHYELEAYKSSLEAIERCLQLKPDYEFANAMKGLVLRFSKRWEQALLTYRKVLELNPEDPWTLMEIAITLRFQDPRQCDQAAERLNKIAESDPNYPLVNAQLAVCRYILGEYSPALDAAAKELENDPSQIWLHQVKCLCYERLGEMEKSERAEALALESQGYTRSLADRAATYSDLYEYRRAERDYRLAIRETPDDFNAYNGLAWTLAEEIKERLEEALELAGKGVDLVRRTADMKEIALLMDTQAWVLFRMGRRDPAQRMLEQALDLYSENLEIHDHLAVIRSAA